MRFLNFEKLSFTDSNDWNEVSFETEIKCDVTLKQMQAALHEIVGAQIDNMPIQDGCHNFNYNIIIVDDEEAPMTEEEVVYFAESIANVVNSDLFNTITRIGNGRNRERRLDVPDNMKLNTYTSMSLIKDAINFKTIFDNINVTINFSLKTSEGLFNVIIYNLVEQNKLNSK